MGFEQRLVFVLKVGWYYGLNFVLPKIYRLNSQPPMLQKETILGEMVLKEVAKLK